jgi:hypothetical protein
MTKETGSKDITFSILMNIYPNQAESSETIKKNFEIGGYSKSED